MSAFGYHCAAIYAHNYRAVNGLDYTTYYAINNSHPVNAPRGTISVKRHEHRRAFPGRARKDPIDALLIDCRGSSGAARASRSAEDIASSIDR